MRFLAFYFQFFRKNTFFSSGDSTARNGIAGPASQSSVGNACDKTLKDGWDPDFGQEREIKLERETENTSLYSLYSHRGYGLYSPFLSADERRKTHKLKTKEKY